MPHRIETYIHSDSLTENKGGAMIMVSTETDFALKSAAFVGFCSQLVKMVYAFQTTELEPIFEQMPLLKDEFEKLQSKEKPFGLGEKIKLLGACVFTDDGKTIVKL